MKQYTPKQIKFIAEQFQQGQKAIQTGKFDRAEKHYLEILRVDAHILDAKNALAFVYTFSKQHEEAIAQLKSIIDSTPNDANAHHNLANNLYELKAYDEAIMHYKMAISINHNLLDAYTQCGIIYHKLMKCDLALQYLHQALNLDTNNPKILHELGITYAEIKDYPKAIELVSRSVKLAPNNMEFNLSLAKVLDASDRGHEVDIQYYHTCNTFPNYLEAFIAYGELLKKNRYFDEALECFQHANKLSPQQPDILDNLGNIYLSLANIEMAINLFSQALTKEPNRIPSLIGIEQAYQESGKVEEAIAICDKIISLDVNLPTGYVLKTNITKSRSDDGLAESLINLTTLDQLTDNDKVLVNFALGKVYDDHKNYKQAFKHYAVGNNLKMESLHYEENLLENEFSQIIEFFNADFYRQYKHLGSESDLPIFIVGMPRSGSTLTEQIISSHKQVMGAGEVSFWLPVTSRASARLNTETAYPSCLNKLNQTHANTIIKEYEAKLRKITGATHTVKHITDKMPHNFLALGLIALLFPNAKIIHTKRSPIDTCLSIYFQNFLDFHTYSFNLISLGKYYNQYERIMQHWHSVLPGRIMDIYYADTIAEPEYWSRKLIEHIGLEWDDTCLAPHKLERSVKTASHWQVRQPIYKTSLERWKNYEEFLDPLIHVLKTN